MSPSRSSSSSKGAWPWQVSALKLWTARVLRMLPSQNAASADPNAAGSIAGRRSIRPSAFQFERIRANESNPVECHFERVPLTCRPAVCGESFFFAFLLPRLSLAMAIKLPCLRVRNRYQSQGRPAELISGSLRVCASSFGISSLSVISLGVSFLFFSLLACPRGCGCCKTSSETEGCRRAVSVIRRR